MLGAGGVGGYFGGRMVQAGSDVTFLVRESSYWGNVLPAEESAVVGRIIREAGFEPARRRTPLYDVVETY